MARYSPLLAAHLMQPACSFSANFGLSLYCSRKNTEKGHTITKEKGYRLIVTFQKFTSYLKLIFTKKDVKTNEYLLISTYNDLHVGLLCDLGTAQFRSRGRERCVTTDHIVPRSLVSRAHYSSEYWAAF